MSALTTFASILAQSSGNGGPGGAAFLAFPCVVLLIGVALFGLFIWALVDAIQNPRLDSNKRLIWILVIIFTSPIGSLLYLIIGRNG